MGVVAIVAGVALGGLGGGGLGCAGEGATGGFGGAYDYAYDYDYYGDCFDDLGYWYDCDQLAALREDAREYVEAELTVQPVRPAAGWKPWSRGASLALDEARGLVHVADADLQALITVRTDGGGLIRTTPFGGDPAEVVVGPGGDAFVTVRDADLVAVVRDGVVVQEIPTEAEPFGVALSPDGAALFVTTVAQPGLTVFSTAGGARLGRVELPSDPRGISVTPDGRKAVVSHVAPGSATVIRLRRRGVPGDPVPARLSGHAAVPSLLTTNTGLSPTWAFSAPVVSPDGKRIFVPHNATNPSAGAGPLGSAVAYYGTAESPTMRPTLSELGDGGGLFWSSSSERLADLFLFNGLGGYGPTDGHVRAQELIRQARPHVEGASLPRSAAHHPTESRLLVAMQGTDNVVEYNTAAEHPAFAVVARYWVGDGPKGIVIDADGASAYVHLEFSRAVAIVPLHGELQIERIYLPVSPLPHAIQYGRKLFHAASEAQMTGGPHVICAGCHPEGRTDRIVWSFAGRPRNAPALAGRLEHTAPYNWDGDMETLDGNVARSIMRMGGPNLGVEEQAEALAQYLLYGLPRLRPALVPDADADADADADVDVTTGLVAHGEALFHSDEVGCASCHAGPHTTDGQSHDLPGSTGIIDTPSLRAVSRTAPYFHDGRYETLTELLTDRFVDMGDTSGLTATDFKALEAYLLTL